MEGVNQQLLWRQSHLASLSQWLRQPLLQTLLLSAVLHLLWLQPPQASAMQLISRASAASLPVSIAFAAAAKPEVQAQDEHETLEPVLREETLKQPVFNETGPAELALPKTTPKAQPPLLNHAVEDFPEAEATAEQLQAVAIESESPAPADDNQLPVINEPRFSAQPQPPVYPKLALKRRWQGQALVQALVNEQGETERVELVETTGYALLDQSALKAVSGWRFAAAEQGARSIRAWVQVPVNFTIR